MGTMLFATASCSSELADEPSTPSGNGDSKLKLELTLDGTRAFTDKTSFTEGDEVLVIASVSDDFFANCKATYTNGKWVLEGDGIDLKNINGQEAAEGQTRIYIYYPYAEAKAGNESNSRVNISNALGQIDYIAGVDENVSISNSIAKVTMTHAMSRVRLNINNPSANNVTVRALKMSCYTDSIYSNPWFYDKGYIAFYYGKARTYRNNSNMPEEYTLELDTPVEIPGEGSAEINLLMPDNDYAYLEWEKLVAEFGKYDSGIRFELVTTDKNYTFNVSTPHWNSGIVTTYNVTLNDKPATPTYDKNGIIDGHEYVDLGLSALWATCNIGAATAQDYGLYFQYGYTRGVEANTPNMGEGYFNLTIDQLLEQGIIVPFSYNRYGDYYNLTSAYDPAVQNWRGSWKTPNAAEMEELINNTTVSVVSNEDGKEIGIKMQSNVAGFEGQSIFLPFAGSYSTTTSSQWLTGYSIYYATSTIGSGTNKWCYLISYLIADGTHPAYLFDVNKINEAMPIRPVYPK